MRIWVSRIISHTRNDGIKVLHEKVSKDEAVWKDRGKDKKKRDIEEYKRAVKTKRIKNKCLSLFRSLSNDYHMYNKSMSIL